MSIKIEQILETMQKQGPNKGRLLESFGGKDIVNYTQNVTKYGDAWQKALQKADVKKINALMKSMKDAKDVEAAHRKVEVLKKAFNNLTASLKGQKEISEKSAAALSTVSAKLEEAAKDAAKLTDEFNRANATGFGKFKYNLQDIATSKWTAFASGTTAIGLFANALHSIDRAGKLTQQSLLNMSTDEVADKFGILEDRVELSSNAFVRFGQELYATGKGYGAISKQNIEAVSLQNKLAQATVSTGKTMEELEETAGEAMSRFRMTLEKDGAQKIAEVSKQAVILGQAVGIGTSEALDYFQQQLRKSNVSLEGSRAEMVGMVQAANNLKVSFKDASISTKDITQAVIRSTQADERGNQNIRIKTELMRQQVAWALKRGMSEEQALKQGEAAANSLAKTSDLIRIQSGLKMAGAFEKEVAQIKALKKRADSGDKKAEAEFLQRQAKFEEKYTADIKDEKLKEKTLTRLRDLQGKVNKGVISGFSLADTLSRDLGSTMVGQKTAFDTMKKTFGHLGGQALIVFKDQFKEQGMDDDTAQALAERYMEAFKDNVSFEKFTDTAAAGTKAAEAQKGLLEKTADSIEAAAKRIAQSKPITNIVTSLKSLLQDPLVSAGLGAVAATASIAAYALNTMATKANTAAMLKMGSGGSGGGDDYSTDGPDKRKRKQARKQKWKTGGKGFFGKTMGAAKGFFSSGGVKTAGKFLSRAGGAALGAGLSLYSGLSETSDAVDQAKKEKKSEKEISAIKTKGYSKTAGATVGAGLGGWGGAAAGAAIGTMILPGIGTAVGGLIGGGLAAWGGTVAGEKMGELIADKMLKDNVASKLKAPEIKGAAPKVVGVGAPVLAAGTAPTVAPTVTGAEGTAVPAGANVLDPSGVQMRSDGSATLIFNIPASVFANGNLAASGAYKSRG